MAASDTARNAARLIALHGETMVLKRASEATVVVLKGKRLVGSTVDIGGSASSRSSG